VFKRNATMPATHVNARAYRGLLTVESLSLFVRRIVQDVIVMTPLKKLPTMRAAAKAAADRKRDSKKAKRASTTASDDDDEDDVDVDFDINKATAGARAGDKPSEKEARKPRKQADNDEVQWERERRQAMEEEREAWFKEASPGSSSVEKGFVWEKNLPLFRCRRSG
jgi:hypothetical protein